MVPSLLLLLPEGAVMTGQQTTTGDQHAAYVVHTMSCRTCWVDKSKCPVAVELDPWREAQR